MDPHIGAQCMWAHRPRHPDIRAAHRYSCRASPGEGGWGHGGEGDSANAERRALEAHGGTRTLLLSSGHRRSGLCGGLLGTFYGLVKHRGQASWRSLAVPALRPRRNTCSRRFDYSQSSAARRTGTSYTFRFWPAAPRICKSCSNVSRRMRATECELDQPPRLH